MLKIKKQKKNKKEKRERRGRKREKNRLKKNPVWTLILCLSPPPPIKTKQNKKTHIKDKWWKHRSKKNERKTFQIKLSGFYLETTTQIPLATMNWQIRNWLCGRRAGIFRRHLPPCHYRGWPTSERASEQLGPGWACAPGAAAGSRGQSFPAKHAFDMLSFSRTWKSPLASRIDLQEMEPCS